MVYGVTSLSPARATPGRLLALVRGQWQIENQSHWVRDVTFDEDRSQVRCGNIPKSWPRYATPRLACSGGLAIRILQQRAVSWRPSRHRHWRSSGLTWKTK